MDDREIEAYYNAIELQDFKHKPHVHYQFYIDLHARQALTYRKQLLGRVLTMETGRDRLNYPCYKLTVLGVNNRLYQGMYYADVERFALLQLIEDQLLNGNVYPIRPRNK